MARTMICVLVMCLDAAVDVVQWNRYGMSFIFEDSYFCCSMWVAPQETLQTAAPVSLREGLHRVSKFDQDYLF